MRSFISKSLSIIIIVALTLNASPLLAHQGSGRVSGSSEAADEHPYLVTDGSVHYIVINDNGFTPSQINLEQGESLTWHNATATTQNIHRGIPLTNTNISVFLPIIVNTDTNQLQTPAQAAEPNAPANAAAEPPIATLAPGADYTLTFDQIGAHDYYLEASPQFTSQVVVTARASTTVLHTSPTHGEGEVAVTRETIIEFNHPLAPASVTTAAIYAQFGGQDLAGSVHLAPDGRKVTLFYDQPLPASARVRLTIDGDQLTDEEGNPVDADGDGLPGGVAVVDFDTLGITVIPGTSVCGTVYASELGDDGSGGAIDVPLEGTTITVDGMETTLLTVTNANGDFCLDPAPAGRFFVHIDGRTASVGVPPGAYYPSVGKAWESIPGTQTSVGVAHLPLVVPGTLQPTSQTDDTTIHFPATVLSEHPEFADVAIMVPADSLFANDGARGGQVGIAPVPPDRLPGTLPENLRFPVVITVQTDGATNFDTPAPVCFPNLPDPDTGETLAPGAKSALMSFNHDSGRWEYVGSMTISDDGALVCSDPGVGILAPGWHGSGPPPVGPPPPPPPPSTCSASSSTATSASDNPTESKREKCLRRCDEDLSRCLNYVAVAYTIATAGCFLTTAGFPACMAAAATAYALGDIHCRHNAAVCEERCREDHCEGMPGSLTVSDIPNTTITSKNDLIVDQIHKRIQQINDLISPFVMAGDDIPQNIMDQVNALMGEANALAGGDALQYMENHLLQLEQAAASLEADIGEAAGSAPPYPVLYMAEIKRPNGTTLRLRGETEPDGQYSLFVPRDGTLLFVSFYDQQVGSYGIVYPRIRSSASYLLPRFYLQPLDDSFPDYDGDSLPDVVELVFGTGINKPDTDGDGIPDGAEVQQGTNPVDGLPVQTGIIASADTPGNAVDVCALNNLAIVADSDAGISVFNVNNGQTPTTIAQVDTPGQATRVTCANDTVAVADGSAGLAIVDISDPPAAKIVHQLALGDVTAVAQSAGIVYAGAADGTVTAFSLPDGALIGVVNIVEPVLDLQLGRDVLYAYAKADLYTISLLGGMAVIDNDDSPGTYAANEIRPLRLFVGDGIAYAVHRKGYTTFDLTDPANPVLIANGDTPQFGWRQIVDNGSGLGLATVGPNSNADGPHHVSLYDVGDPTQTNQFLTEFATPGLATAVSIYNGLAYVADGEAGLQVINYLAYDAQGVAPTIDITTNGMAGAIEEGQVLHFGAAVNDDVQVRNVEFYVDGQLATVDGNFPFAYRLLAPLLSQQSAVELTAKATDTGGNVAWAAPVNLTITPDMTPPQVTHMVPADGASLFDTAFPVSTISANFNEPIDPATLTADSFQLYAGGTDGVIGTDDDVQIQNGTLSHHEILNMALITFADPLPAGQYAGIFSGDVTDVAGNALTPYSWQFQITDGAFGDWNLSRVIPFEAPQAAHYNPVNGLIYVGRRGANTDGLYRIGRDDSATQVATGSNVAAVAVDHVSGNIFFSEDFDGVIYRTEITGTGRARWVSGFHSGDDDVVGMAFAPTTYSGAVISPGGGLVVDRGQGGPDDVWRFSPDTAEGETVIHDDDGTLIDSVDIAIGHSDVYLVDDKDGGDGVIYRLNADGSLTAITPVPPLPAPEGIAIDPVTGNLLIQDVVKQQIVSMNPETGDLGDALPGFAFAFTLGSSWAGVDISPDGQQFIVSDKGADAIYVFTRAVD